MGQGSNDETKPDFFCLYQFFNFVARHQSSNEIFAMIKLYRMAAVAIIEHYCVTYVAHDGRIWKNLADNLWIGPFITGFLAQLALTGRLRRSIRTVNHPSGDFQFYGVGTMPVLLNHHELLVGGDCYHIHPVD